MDGVEETKSTTLESAHVMQISDAAAQQGTRRVDGSGASPVQPEAVASQSSSAEWVDEGPLKAPTKDLRDAIRAGSKYTLDELLERPGSEIELMAQNAANGAGLLMIAAEMGNEKMLEYLACKIREKLGTRKLAKQLRFEDDDKKPLMFYAAKSSPKMFSAAERLIRDTIGEVGLVEQLKHRSAIGGTILMEACNNPGTFEGAWALLKQTGCLRGLLDSKDENNRSWILYAAESGNLEALSKPEIDISAFSSKDNEGWSGFMYAARGRGATNASFLEKICESAKLVDNPQSEAHLKQQLTRVANDSDRSTLLMHAAIGGRESYSLICKLMRENGCVDDWRRGCDGDAVLLSWAAEGGDIHVFEMVAQGIKTREFPDSNSERPWVSCSPPETDNLVCAIRACTKRPERSLFISAVKSNNADMIRDVGQGITSLIQDSKECWEMICGNNGGNPLTVAAGKSVTTFKATFGVLQDAAETLGSRGEEKPDVTKLLLPDGEATPLCSAVYIEDSSLFDEVLETANAFGTQASHGRPPSGSVILAQVRHAMTPANEPGQPSEEIISAKMLAKVLKAVKRADRSSDGFEVKKLDKFMEKAVLDGAFDHISELLKNGCDLEKHFTTVLRKIGKDEIDTSQCMILAITMASNPFRECGIASKAIFHAMEKRDKDYAALSRLQQKIGDLTLELLDHLPHTVTGVGEELSRGHRDFEPFKHNPVGKVEPKRLLGFLAVGWMLEGWGYSSSASELIGGENSLVQAVRSGPRALDFFSEPLVLDYLDTKFSRTLPDWDTQKPFKRNINQAFYRYRQQARKPRTNTSQQDYFQLLLLFLQGWEINQGWKFFQGLKTDQGTPPRMRTVLPGLQFILAGIIGKPVSYYVVPMIRMAFVVINYIATIVLYLSCVSLQSRDIPWNEWMFYGVMLGVVWREALEFSNAKRLEPGIGASIHRYFCDKWNFLDVLTVAVVFVAFAFRIMELVNGSDFDLFVAQLFLASAAPLLFSRVLFLSQAGGTLGPMTQVIFNMVAQLSRFSLILLIVMLGFAATFNALYAEDTALVAQNVDDCDVNNHPIVEAFGTVGAALLTMFVSMLGEFKMEIFTDHYENGEGRDCGGVIYGEAGITLMVIYLVITTVMLLNLLIAILSTAHSDVQKNAQKEFQFVRAQVILQSAADVRNDVLPPPFNLLKPVFSIIWPVISTDRNRCDSWWEMMAGTLHRLIFAFTVGVVALVISTILCMVSSPMHAWRVSEWLSKKAFPAKPDEGQSSQGRDDDSRRLSSGYSSTFSQKSSGEINDVEEGSDSSLMRQSHFRELSYPENEMKKSEERIFFLGSDDPQGTLSRTLVRSILFLIIRVPVVLSIAVFLCCLYPLLNAALWLRGLVDILQYARAMLRKTNPWKRRQVDLGEEEEWSMARNHAVEMNRRFCGANKSPIHEFNVNVLLKTTTGMTMEVLRQEMASLKSSRRHRALRASIDAVVTRFLPDEDSMDGDEIAGMEKRCCVPSHRMKRKTS